MQAKLLQLCLTLCDPMDCSCQAPLSMGFSRQESWSGLPCPPSGTLPNLGIEPTSLMSPALAGRFFTTSTTWEAPAGRVKFGKSEPQHHGTSTSMDVELELSRCDKWFMNCGPISVQSWFCSVLLTLWTSFMLPVDLFLSRQPELFSVACNQVELN